MMPQFVNGERLQTQFKWRRLYHAVAVQPPARPQGEVVNQVYAVQVKQSIEFLRQLIDHADERTWLTLEGDLSRFNSSGLSSIRRENFNNGQEDDLFAPLHSRVTIPLNQDNAFFVKGHVLPNVGIRSHIIHLTLERDDNHLFAAHNKFRQCTLYGGWITAEFLTQLLHEGVIEVS
jgi:hypothetical protein